MFKEDLEKVVLYSNVCLKRWSKSKTHLINYESIRSMVNGWIARSLYQQPTTSRIMRKRFSKSLSRTLFVTIHPTEYYITSITIENLVIPTLNFAELAKKAQQLVSESLFPSNLNEFNLNTVQSIKFN